MEGEAYVRGRLQTAAGKRPERGVCRHGRAEPVEYEAQAGAVRQNVHQGHPHLQATIEVTPTTSLERGWQLFSESLRPYPCAAWATTHPICVAG